MVVGMALIVARRLAIMRDHWSASNTAAGKSANATEKSHSTLREVDSGSAMTAQTVTAIINGPPAVSFDATKIGGDGGGGGLGGGGGVIEAGVCLLALEISAMLWLVGGWSALVALRFR